MANVPVLTIDGPSGSGKGTVSRAVASTMQWHFLDSGAVYRSLAYAIIARDIDAGDVRSVSKVAAEYPITFFADGIYYGTEDISLEIRSESCSNVASIIATYEPVRAALMALQRSFAKSPGLVADGRDMGTVVFPDALLKIYLDASTAERAKRRFLQLNDDGFDVNLRDLEAQIVQRDERDKSRAAAPLKPAQDAITINTTDKSVDIVVKIVVDMLRQKLAVD